MRAPGLSIDDAQLIKSCMRTGVAFDAITTSALRETIASKILSLDCMIPSLYIFCKDTKYLEPCASVMKRLLGASFQGTIQNAMRTTWRTDQSFGDGHFALHYRELWTFTMRHFSNLVNVTLRKEPDQGKPVIKEPNPITWYRFAHMAMKLGFKSNKISHLSFSKILDEALRQSLSPITEHIPNQAVVKRLLRQLRRCVVAGGHPMNSRDASESTTDADGLDLPHRCGRPYENAQNNARTSFFLKWIYQPDTAVGRNITSFYVQSAIFRAFFGDQLPVEATGTTHGDTDMAESASQDAGEVRLQRASNLEHRSDADGSNTDNSAMDITPYVPVRDPSSQWDYETNESFWCQHAASASPAASLTASILQVTPDESAMDTAPEIFQGILGNNETPTHQLASSASPTNSSPTPAPASQAASSPAPGPTSPAVSLPASTMVNLTTSLPAPVSQVSLDHSALDIAPEIFQGDLDSDKSSSHQLAGPANSAISLQASAPAGQQGYLPPHDSKVTRQGRYHNLP